MPERLGARFDRLDLSSDVATAWVAIAALLLVVIVNCDLPAGAAPASDA
jgi:hypothetical protein